MATIVNDCGMSPALFAAVKNVKEGYSRTGYLSTTSCIDSPRIRVLEQRHDKEIVINASTLLPSFFGSCIHSEIERAAHFLNVDYAAEKEFVVEVGGIKFSGRPDMFEIPDYCVGDYKTTSVWTFLKNPKGKSEHIKQININAWLIRKYGYQCTRGWIELIFLDWKRSQGQHDPSYPHPVERIEMNDLMPDEEVQSYVEERVRLHLAADKLQDNDLPRCTPEEQWQKPSGWAAMRKGRKSAVKICGTEEEAMVLVADMPRGMGYIEKRTGDRTRCENYCYAKPWCNQYAEERANG